MRYLVLALAVSSLLAGCAGVGSGSPGKPTATVNNQAVVETAPAVTVGTAVKTSATKKGAKPTAETGPTVRPVAVKTPPPLTSKAYTSFFYGTVVDARTHKPIPGAVVAVNSGQRKVRTDAAGQYRIAFPGGYAVPIAVEKKGYNQVLDMGILSPHKSSHYIFKLKRRSSTSAPPVPGIIKGS
jgi:uncharacterized protein YceK